MKKFILGFLTAALLFTAIPVGAAIEEYICYRADYKLVINGQEYNDPDLPLLNYKGYTVASVRKLFEAAGLNVNWNAELGQAEVSVAPVPAPTKEVEAVSDQPVVQLNRYGMPIFMNGDKNPPLENEGNLYYFVYDGVKYVLLDLKERPKSYAYKYTGGILYLATYEAVGDEVKETKIIPEIPHGEYFWESYRFMVTYDYYINTLLPTLKRAG